MGKNKKKEYVLDAVLDEETYMAYKSGQAIDNNGLRSPKGPYWPKQPSYREKNHIKEQLKRAGADMAVGATDYVVFGIGLPMVKRLFHEEVYPQRDRHSRVERVSLPHIYGARRRQLAVDHPRRGNDAGSPP